MFCKARDELDATAITKRGVHVLKSYATATTGEKRKRKILHIVAVALPPLIGNRKKKKNFVNVVTVHYPILKARF